MTGEYSWVDPEGTLHLVRYKADETGYHILESINQPGFVKIHPKTRSSRKLLKRVRVLKSSLGSEIRSNGFSSTPLRRKVRVLRPAASRGAFQQLAPAPEPFLAVPPPRVENLEPEAEFDLTA